jgi:hypothetical protein
LLENLAVNALESVSLMICFSLWSDKGMKVYTAERQECDVISALSASLSQ